MRTLFLTRSLATAIIFASTTAGALEIKIPDHRFYDVTFSTNYDRVAAYEIDREGLLQGLIEGCWKNVPSEDTCNDPAYGRGLCGQMVFDDPKDEKDPCFFECQDLPPESVCEVPQWFSSICGRQEYERLIAAIDFANKNDGKADPKSDSICFEYLRENVWDDGYESKVVLLPDNMVGEPLDCEFKHPTTEQPLCADTVVVPYCCLSRSATGNFPIGTTA